MTDVTIRLTDFGLSFGDQVVFSALDLEVRDRGVHLLMGPVGAGKSALLRTLTGLNRAQPALRTWGECDCQPERLALVAQDARFLISTVRENLCAALPDRGGLTAAEQTTRIRTELASVGLAALGDALRRDVIELPLDVQRRLAIVRAALARPAVLCLDEPTASLCDAGTAAVVELVRLYARRMGVWMVTHDQSVARALGGQVTLIAGGRAQEQGPTCRVLDRPRTAAGQTFVRSGSCAEPSPNTPSHLLRSDLPPPPPLPAKARRSMARARGPRHFYWLIDGLLGGTPRPGIVQSEEGDVRGLGELGVRVLYTLEERRCVSEALLAREGIEGRWVPIPDMGTPPAEVMRTLCEEIAELTAAGIPCAVHCLAGLGRTGTVLCCVLIFRGLSAHEALDTVRALRAGSVQSQAQHAFLLEFESHLRHRPPRVLGEPGPCPG